MAETEFRDDLPHLRAGEAAGLALRRVVRACCEHAMQREAHAPTDDAVHEARRALKRARATLRLEEKLGVAGARTARRRLSAVARELSPRRDAAVAVQMASRLEAKVGGSRPKEPVVTRKSEETEETPGWWPAWQRKVAAEERRLRRHRASHPTAGEVRRVLHHFAKRVCRRARRAVGKGDIGSMHDWRKAVIVLREQVHVVRPLLSDEEAKVAGKLHKLAQRLGKATDYNVLKHMLESRGAPGGRRGRFDCAATERRAHAMRKAWRKWPKVRRALRKRL